MDKDDTNTSLREPHKRLKTYLEVVIASLLKAVFWQSTRYTDKKSPLKGLIVYDFVKDS